MTSRIDADFWHWGEMLPVAWSRAALTPAEQQELDHVIALWRQWSTEHDDATARMLKPGESLHHLEDTLDQLDQIRFEALARLPDQMPR